MAQVILCKSLFYSNLGNAAVFRGAARLSSRARREEKASKRRSICPSEARAYGLANRIILILGHNGLRSRTTDRRSSPD